jgi:uncharacterized integral membrane protein
MVRDPRHSAPITGETRAEPEAGPVDRRLLARAVLAVVALVLAIVFVLQNSERVETTFWVFSVTTRLWVGLLVTLVIGAFLGQATERLWNRRQRSE